MPQTRTNAQVDKLGERLRDGPVSDRDRLELEVFRQSFRNAYDYVIDVVRNQIGATVTGRPSKTTVSIVAKLRRETVRLSQMQDVAGCRIVVRDGSEQDIVVAQLQAHLIQPKVDDRRDRPSHGYRAVHVIASEKGDAVEIQVRTALQHQWAELSEKVSDVLDVQLKYGGGPSGMRELLMSMSSTIGRFEASELQLHSTSALLFAEQDKLTAMDAACKVLQETIDRAPSHDPRLMDVLAEGKDGLVQAEAAVAKRRAVLEPLPRNMDIARERLDEMRELVRQMLTKAGELAIRDESTEATT